MAINAEGYRNLVQELQPAGVTLVAVSKTKPPEDIMELYKLGQRDFGENYVQELVEKQAVLPADIRWHFIGHLQSNKVKYIAPFVHLVHAVDSLKLLKEIDKQAAKAGRTIEVLLQVHIAREETKFGLDDAELETLLQGNEIGACTHIKIGGLMGMASFTTDTAKLRQEFQHLKELFDKYQGRSANNIHFRTLSMGMSSDYRIAMEEGCTMVRIGSILFGARV